MGMVIAMEQNELRIRDARRELELATAEADKEKIFAAHQKLLEALAKRGSPAKMAKAAK